MKKTSELLQIRAENSYQLKTNFRFFLQEIRQFVAVDAVERTRRQRFDGSFERQIRKRFGQTEDFTFDGESGGLIVVKNDLRRAFAQEINAVCFLSACKDAGICLEILPFRDGAQFFCGVGRKIFEKFVGEKRGAEKLFRNCAVFDEHFHFALSFCADLCSHFLLLAIRTKITRKSDRHHKIRKVFLFSLSFRPYFQAVFCRE